MESGLPTRKCRVHHPLTDSASAGTRPLLLSGANIAPVVASGKFASRTPQDFSGRVHRARITSIALSVDRHHLGWDSSRSIKPMRKSLRRWPPPAEAERREASERLVQTCEAALGLGTGAARAVESSPTRPQTCLAP
jgi:hypothetical protein